MTCTYYVYVNDDDGEPILSTGRMCGAPGVARWGRHVYCARHETPAIKRTAKARGLERTDLASSVTNGANG